MCSEEFESIKSCLRNEIDLLKENNKNLEGRIEEMKINLMKMENLNINLKTEVQKSKDLNQRLITIENCSQQKENEASLELIKNLEELMKVNQELKDRNDELETNIINSPKDQSFSQKVDEEKCVKRKVDLQNVSPNMSPKTKWSKKTESLGNDFDDIDEECEELLAVTEANVLLQLQNLKTHPAVSAGLEAGTLDLHGWVYHIGSGAVTCHDAAASKFVPLADHYAHLLS